MTKAKAWDGNPEPRRVLVGLLGRGIQLSRTPAMHEAEGRARGLSYMYRLLDTDRMGDVALAVVLAFAEHFGFDGLNVTFPYKQEIVPLLDDLSEAAQALGSVNTILLRDGRRVGHNTDLWGFRESFRRGLADSRRDHVVLVGAGGGGAAVGHALLESGVGMLSVCDLDPDKASELAGKLARRFGQDRAGVSTFADVAASVDGIVNASPVGMAKMPGIPLDPALLRPECWVADIVYFPLETELLAAARQRGCRVLSGEGMAIHQAARAFELFTGIAPDVERMQAAFAAQGEATAG